MFMLARRLLSIRSLLSNLGWRSHEPTDNQRYIVFVRSSSRLSPNNMYTQLAEIPVPTAAYFGVTEAATDGTISCSPSIPILIP